MKPLAILAPIEDLVEMLKGYKKINIIFTQIPQI